MLQGVRACALAPKSPRLPVNVRELPVTVLRVELSDVIGFHKRQSHAPKRHRKFSSSFLLATQIGQRLRRIRPDGLRLAPTWLCARRSSELGRPEHFLQARTWAQHAVAGSGQSSGACFVEDGQMLQGARARALAPNSPRLSLSVLLVK